jgi:beta-galactosidase
MVYLCAEETGNAHGAAGDTNKAVGQESWNWPDRTPLTVSCYSNCPEVTLFPNGVVVGTQQSNDKADGVLCLKIPFSCGVLKAIGKRDGQEVCTFELKTATAPERIELHADATQLAANGQDVAQVEYDVVDKAGVRIPGAETEVSFEPNGPARILGIGNGDVANSEPVTAPKHRAFEGRGLLIMQSTADPGTTGGPCHDPPTLVRGVNG